jgi:membrane protein implicated in regulation of membrane protease activity
MDLNRLVSLVLALALVAAGAAIMLAIMKVMSGDWGYVLILVAFAAFVLALLWPRDTERRDI